MIDTFIGVIGDFARRILIRGFIGVDEERELVAAFGACEEGLIHAKDHLCSAVHAFAECVGRLVALHFDLFGADNLQILTEKIFAIFKGLLDAG